MLLSRLHYWVAFTLIVFGISTLTQRSPVQGVTSIMPGLGVNPDVVGLILVLGGVCYPLRREVWWHALCASAMAVYAAFAVYYRFETGSGNAAVLTVGLWLAFYITIALHHDRLNLLTVIAQFLGGNHGRD